MRSPDPPGRRPGLRGQEPLPVSWPWSPENAVSGAVASCVLPGPWEWSLVQAAGLSDILGCGGCLYSRGADIKPEPEREPEP